MRFLLGGGVSPILLFLVVVVAFWLLSSIKILSEYERAVVFRLGRLLAAAKGPGIAFVFFPIDRMVRVSLRTMVHDVPPQDVISPNPTSRATCRPWPKSPRRRAPPSSSPCRSTSSRR